MYQVGDLILYGRTGVCCVKEIVEDKNGTKFYTLCPLYQNCNISSPVGSGKVYSRPIITREEAEALIAQMPSVAAQPYYNRNLNQLREYYRSQLESPDCATLILLVKSLYVKKKEAEEQMRKFGAVDERFMKEAENLLFGEFAAALDIERDEVEKYIAKKLAQS